MFNENVSQKTLAVLPTFLSQLIKIAEFLIKTERKICKNTQNILLDGCYQLFEDYLQENTSFYILKPGREIGQIFKKSKKNVYDEVSSLLRTNILHE